jgi:hypothetical protein
LFLARGLTKLCIAQFTSTFIAQHALTPVGRGVQRVSMLSL